MSETPTASDTAEFETKNDAYAEVLEWFGRGCSERITPGSELERVAQHLFAESLGQMDGGAWKYRKRWGKQASNEDANADTEETEPPPRKNDVSPQGQRKFRKHMKHLARCMGYEAEVLRAGQRLTPEVLHLAIVNVMARSHANGCYPLKRKSGGICEPVKFAAFRDGVREPMVPDVCESVLQKFFPPVG